jgi:hypothetical protein
MPYIREDMADIRVTVDGVPYGDSWYSVEGGNLEADDSKVRPGGMGDEVSLGGPASRDDVPLETKVIEDAPTKVAYTFLNRLKQPIGISHTVTGTLKGVTIPDMDTGSSDAAMYELVISCDERAA